MKGKIKVTPKELYNNIVAGNFSYTVPDGVSKILIFSVGGGGGGSLVYRAKASSADQCNFKSGAGAPGAIYIYDISDY